MAGCKLRTNLSPDKALKVAWRAAQAAGFAPSPLADGASSFVVSKGSWLLNALAGNLFTPHCRFRVSVESYGNGTDIVLEVESSATITTGAIGAKRVNRQADGLLSAIALAVSKEGGQVLERKEF